MRDLLARFLAEHGYRVTTAASAAEARAKRESARLRRPRARRDDAGRDRLRLRAAACAQTSQVPILMLTARADTDDRVTGLEIGADDYLPKPFEPRELLLRLGNILQARSADAGAAGRRGAEVVRFGPFIFRFDRGELRRGDEIVRITEREREILTILGAPRRRQRAARGARRRRQRPPTSAPSTCRSTGCAARSRSIRPIPSTCRPCAASATGCVDRPMNAMRRPAQSRPVALSRPLSARWLGAVPAEGPLCALADHHHRAGGAAAIGHRLRLHGAALADS